MQHCAIDLIIFSVHTGSRNRKPFPRSIFSNFLSRDTHFDWTCASFYAVPAPFSPATCYVDSEELLFCELPWRSSSNRNNIQTTVPQPRRLIRDHPTRISISKSKYHYCNLSLFWLYCLIFSCF